MIGFNASLLLKTDVFRNYFKDFIFLLMAHNCLNHDS